MIKRVLALILTVAVTLPGCATTTRRLDRADPAPFDARQTPERVTPTTAGRRLLADYVQKLPVGTRVRVHQVDGQRQRGTLMDATAERIVIQPRTRIPEPAMEIPLDRIVAVDIETSNGSVARAIGIGVAAGAGAILGVMLLLAAIYAD